MNADNQLLQIALTTMERRQPSKAKIVATIAIEILSAIIIGIAACAITPHLEAWAAGGLWLFLIVFATLYVNERLAIADSNEQLQMLLRRLEGEIN